MVTVFPLIIVNQALFTDHDIAQSSGDQAVVA